MYAKARRSVVAACAIPAGTRITREMLTIKRPGHGIAPKLIDALVGRIAAVDIDDDDSPHVGDAVSADARAVSLLRRRSGRRASATAAGWKRSRRRRRRAATSACSCRSPATELPADRRDRRRLVPATRRRPCVRGRAGVIAAVDDLARDLAVDLVVDPSPGALGAAHRRARRVLAGAAYALVPPPDPGVREVAVAAPVARMLVTTGAADAAGHRRAARRRARVAPARCRVRLVVGPVGRDRRSRPVSCPCTRPTGSRPSSRRPGSW